MKKPEIIQHTFRLPFTGTPVLATGSRYSNTLCITGHDEAWLTASLGDLDSASIDSRHEVTATELMVWRAVIPAVIVRDLDPDMHSARYAIELAHNLGVPPLAVQHHHAHVAAVCAEHAVLEPVVGLVLDEHGMGSDGASWGGELLYVDGASVERIGHLMPLAQPGGQIALRETWRVAASVLHRLQRSDDIRRRFSEYPAVEDVITMLDESRNCPQTTSAGLLMATAANLLRLTPPAPTKDYRADHQALLALFEQTAAGHFTGNYASLPRLRWHIEIGKDGLSQLDLYLALNYLANEHDIGRGAAFFHANLIAGAAEWVADGCAKALTRKVVLAGACMSNQLLATGLRDTLERRGLTVYSPQQVAPNDSAIALGQAWVALNSLRQLAD